MEPRHSSWISIVYCSCTIFYMTMVGPPLSMKKIAFSVRPLSRFAIANRQSLVSNSVLKSKGVSAFKMWILSSECTKSTFSETKVQADIAYYRICVLLDFWPSKFTMPSTTDMSQIWFCTWGNLKIIEMSRERFRRAGTDSSSHTYRHWKAILIMCLFNNRCCDFSFVKITMND